MRTLAVIVVLPLVSMLALGCGDDAQSGPGLEGTTHCHFSVAQKNTILTASQNSGLLN